jgi:hypothetical protein
MLEFQNSILKHVSFTRGCSDLWFFSGISETEILEMQNSSLKQVSFTRGCSDLWFFLESQRARS